MNLNFQKGGGLVPAIIQDKTTNEVLMLGFMNQQALKKTIEKGKVTFYSRSKKRLWTKGESSGNFLLTEEVLPDCDNDTLLIKVTATGPACHTGENTCFNFPSVKGFLYRLESIIKERKEEPVPESYTARLLASGINKVAQKVGEEAVELIIEAKDENDDRFKNEAADLVFHLLLLLSAKGVEITDIEKVLADRNKQKGR